MMVFQASLVLERIFVDNYGTPPSGFYDIEYWSADLCHCMERLETQPIGQLDILLITTPVIFMNLDMPSDIPMMAVSRTGIGTTFDSFMPGLIDDKVPGVQPKLFAKGLPSTKVGRVGKINVGAPWHPAI